MNMHSESYSLIFENLWMQAIRLTALWVVIISFSSLPAFATNIDKVTDENVSNKIEKATTLEDYQALKAYFKGKSAEAARQVSLHEGMLQSFSRRPDSDSRAIQVRIHCLKLIRLSLNTQGNYDYLAEFYEKLAMQPLK